VRGGRSSGSGIQGGAAGMPLAAWAAEHASLGVGGVPLAGGSRSFVVWRCWLWVSGRKSCPTWSVPATAAPEGVVLPPWRRCRGVSTPLTHHSGVKTQIRLAGLDDGGVFGRRDLLGGVIFRNIGRLFAMLGLLVGSSSSGSVGARVPLACFSRHASPHEA
jgi:hypothetical protein